MFISLPLPSFDASILQSGDSGDQSGIAESPLTELNNRTQAVVQKGDKELFSKDSDERATNPRGCDGKFKVIENSNICAVIGLEKPDLLSDIEADHSGILEIESMQSQEVEESESSWYSSVKAMMNTFIGCWDSEKKVGAKQYVQFTHGMFEIKQDPSSVIDSKNKSVKMKVPREQKFSERIAKIEVDPSVDYKAVLNSLRQQESPDKKLIKETKIKAAIKQMMALAKIEDKKRVEDDALTSYMWGDVADEGSSSPGLLQSREWKIVPEDIKHYLRLCGAVNKVKMVFRGHQHKFAHHQFKDKSAKGKVVVSTLPVGMDDSYKAMLPGQDDCFYVLTTAPKVKEWTKIAMTRAPGSSIMKFSESRSIFSLSV